MRCDSGLPHGNLPLGRCRFEVIMVPKGPLAAG